VAVPHEISRRELLAASAALFPSATSAENPRISKAVYLGMLPKSLSYAQRFRLARDAGFEQIECATVTDRAEAQEIKNASEAAGLPIHSVMNQVHWRYPLSSADQDVVARSLKGMRTSLENASFWGAGVVLLVPAVVNPQTGYREAWARSQEQIRKLIPLANKLRVVIGIENVWNKFLLSPIEFARYIDGFSSPWVRAYFDVGNVLLYGYPQDWIRTLGKRIVRLHLKDFRLRGSTFEWTALGEGDVDWPEVSRALAEIGFNGIATCELPAGDEAYLREVSQRVDRLLSRA
jgi:L-ribulose-5-phosphate 3-epimerase